MKRSKYIEDLRLYVLQISLSIYNHLCLKPNIEKGTS